MHAGLSCYNNFMASLNVFMTRLKLQFKEKDFFKGRNIFYFHLSIIDERNSPNYPHTKQGCERRIYRLEITTSIPYRVT